jgi:hypothetical protein
MKNNCLHTTQRILLSLLWSCLLVSQTTRAQSIPDAQWARVGHTLDITTDGNIVTAEAISFPPLIQGSLGQNGDRLVKYSVRGDQIWSTSLLKGGFFLGGKLPGFDYEAIGRITAAAASADGGVTVAGPLNLRGGTNVAVKVNRDGVSGSWQETDVFFASFNADVPSDMVTTPDGGFIILSSATASQPNTPSTVVLRRYNGSKQLVWTKQIAYPGSANPDVGLTKGNTIINTPDSGYLVTGYYNPTGSDTPATGWVAKLDEQGNVSWQKLINSIPITTDFNGPVPGTIIAMISVTDVITMPGGTGYALAGSGIQPTSVATLPPRTAILELDLNGNYKPGRAKAIDTSPFTNAYLTAYTGSGGKKYYVVGKTSLENRTDPQVLLVNPTSLSVVASRTFPGPGQSHLTDIATAGDGSIVFVTDNNQLVKLQPEPTTPIGGPLALTAPTYNCTTGAFTFNTSGGNGSTIEYLAPGITGWTTNPNQFVDEGSRTANDVQPFTLTARQNGVTVIYIWDLRAYCNGTPPQPPVNPPIGGALTLTAPTYNCATGAFTFNTSGGNGSTIEYLAPGITGWTTNPNQFVDQGSRTANDVQPFTLTARQSGVTVTYVWDLKAACGRARTAALPEPGIGLQVRVLGNPVTNQTVEMEIIGAEQQVLHLNLVDLQGRVLHQQRIDQPDPVQRVRVPMGEQSGLFFLNVSTPTQHQQVKLVKP